MPEIFFGGGPITPQKYFLAQIRFFPIIYCLNFPKKYFLNFYTKITFLGSLGIKLMGKNKFGPKNVFWGVMGPPPKFSDI